MAKAKIKTIKYFTFKCPGCAHEHTVPIDGTGDDWVMTGTEDSPTLEPSILNYISKQKEIEGIIAMEKTEICHLFIRHGKIEYCSDSQHSLSGKIIEMEQF